MKKSKEILDLEKIIEESKKKIIELSKVEAAIIPLSSYTIEEKVKFFNDVYNTALCIVEQAEKEEYFSEDNEHWMYEVSFCVLNLRDKKSFNKYINTL